MDDSLTYLLMITFRVFLLELPVAAFNAFVLMDRVYAPRWGTLRAHQVAMATRIGYLLLFAYVLVRSGHDERTPSLALAGLF